MLARVGRFILQHFHHLTLSHGSTCSIPCFLLSPSTHSWHDLIYSTKNGDSNNACTSCNRHLVNNYSQVATLSSYRLCFHILQFVCNQRHDKVYERQRTLTLKCLDGTPMYGCKQSFRTSSVIRLSTCTNRPVREQQQ